MRKYTFRHRRKYTLFCPRDKQPKLKLTFKKLYKECSSDIKIGCKLTLKFQVNKGLRNIFLVENYGNSLRILKISNHRTSFTLHNNYLLF